MNKPKICPYKIKWKTKKLACSKNRYSERQIKLNRKLLNEAEEFKYQVSKIKTDKRTRK